MKQNFAKFFRNYLWNPKNTYVTCGVGVDVNKFKPFKSSEVIEGSELKCVLVSRLLKDKGINEYIEASKALSKSYNQLIFTLIGSEDPHSPMKLTNRMNNLRNSPVKYISHIDNINEHLPKYDIFILPSYHEGLSVSSMEAGACGLVLLLSDIPGCRLVVEGYNGFTFKNKALRLSLKSYNISSTIRKIFKRCQKILENIFRNIFRMIFLMAR